MKAFSSLAAVLGLWLAVSFVLWLGYRIFRRHDGSKLLRVAAAPIALIDEGAAILGALRMRASLSPNAQGSYGRGITPDDELREDVRHLLNAIEAQSSYFDRVNVARKRVQATFDLPDFPALSEVLQIRRDLWAASEIFLMEDIAALGPELADATSLTAFKAEAQQLLFKDETALSAPSAAHDPVALRLAVAREDAVAFSTQIEREIEGRLEKSRFPTPSEFIAVPWALLKAFIAGVREIRHLLGDAAITAQSLARAMTSKGLKGAADELRRVRGEMPEQFAAAFERAGGLARQGGQSLKRHYEFVLEAQELRARYAEFLARAPEISERGKQFLARLELEKRAEQFRETSGDVFHWTRQGMVVAIAHLIALLQHLQAKITPREHKQLAPIVSAAASAALGDPRPPAASADLPLRALLLPSSAYSSVDRSTGTSRSPRGSQPVSPGAGDVAQTAGSRPRDPVLSEANGAERANRSTHRPAANPRKPKAVKPRLPHAEGLAKTSFKELLEVSAEEEQQTGERAAGRAGSRSHAGRGSLRERLASIAQADAPEPAIEEAAPQPEASRRMGFFRLKRK